MIAERLKKKNDPIGIFEGGAKTRLLRGAEIAEETCETVYRAERESRELISALLINTPGGYVTVGQPLTDAVRYMSARNIGTWAFVDNEALSYGGYLLMDSTHRVVRGGSDIMFHQTYFMRPKKQPILDEKSPQEPELAFPRGDFQRTLRAWLANNAYPEHVSKALTRANRAFQDPKNHLDDVRFKGWELARMGLVDEKVRGTYGLAKRYSEISGTPPHSWHPVIRRFFY